MLDPKHFDDLARRVTESLPESVRSVQEDVHRQVRSSLQAGLERMDVVTREDFDVQVALLERTRERLAELEARVEALEQNAGAQDSTSDN